MTRSKKSQNDIKEAISIIDSKNAHPRRPRCKYMGEMIQMDASSFEWIDGHIWHLHLAVDDATGEVVGAYFDTQETLNGYYNVFYQILTNYGIPAMFIPIDVLSLNTKRKTTLLMMTTLLPSFPMRVIILALILGQRASPKPKAESKE